MKSDFESWGEIIQAKAVEESAKRLGEAIMNDMMPKLDPKLIKKIKKIVVGKSVEEILKPEVIRYYYVEEIKEKGWTPADDTAFQRACRGDVQE
jgi:uncharacterized protein (DUF111 family)